MDVTGLAELLTTILEGIANIDLKLINFDYLGPILDFFHPIWNPIWEIVEEFLKGYFYPA